MKQVSDAVVSTPAGTGDLPTGQVSDNYGYDAIGNLVKDESEGIASGGIEWNVYGKISQITKTNSGVTTVIKYTYDATGNRIGKWVQVGAGTPKQTAYVRDASGNVMAIYEKGNSEVNGGLLSQIEVPLCGSSRLGVWRPDREVETTGWELFDTDPMTGTGGGIAGGWERGRVQFELSNHLGNVLVTISDVRIPVLMPEGIELCDDPVHPACYRPIDYYLPQVLTANDYYPFGMGMPGRKYSEGEYRYGFNGKEKDSDINSLTAYDYGFRIYNPAIGRFLSVDPLSKSYPWYTPYQFASNSPVLAIDVDGLESSNDKNPTAPQPLSVPPATPDVNPNQVRSYNASKWWMVWTRLIPSTGVVEHSHANTINEIYSNTGGDNQFNVNAETINLMNSNLVNVRPGSIIQNPGAPQAVTNINKAFYSASESGNEKTWINLMLGGMIRGTIPENIVFSENGIVSNYLLNSPIYNDLLSQWDRRGRPSMDNTPLAFNYGVGAQLSDIANNFSVYSMSNFVGSASGTILANPGDNTIILTITNVTSVHSGDLMKHMSWHNDEAPFLYRDPSNGSPQPYTNFSQTYRLRLNYNDVIRKLGIDEAVRKAERPIMRRE